ncbi:2',3'-cyclic-nucleotide 2'-phosphodiesterase [Bacillus spizizenii]|uniref:2',3'-cyclic-nucleotide 2'-phosphodiesterase n=1 Tax=Bacillus spizizenii TaxID=96241 RepID=UPI0005C9435A|nr:2',3'-cyclic-nucleotide 2'-phosphodiesterase [Bacillus spizizenii]MCY7867772.1 2',3'-cyclic-nucleotide 2'-phosphodiesterase [Bacillus spizizenii]MCY7972697.1 2',3'-cyclic-nucleotide 2'-phosphodiesterase [Bacillus spizizenii]MCY8118758.1 2',3'-cyclic-nucleotide 2'-phosphodiesterase [Bacillus spizizenii]MCY8128087.1 2',3'-cyclic-nucleotide 2'-phosphodiesterase [Bacillus spizizenii]MCY8167627.1 2',3'-cyclic-nucleotide 2'-phosphodiesterase [Bacillus spizizenii]
MRILFIGDVVGSPGRDMVKEYVPKLKTKYKPHFTIINGENAAHGKGLTEKIYHSLIQSGADAITMGNHTWDKKEIFDFIDDVPNLVRPANFPEGTPGKGITYVKANGKELAVINLQGRTFLPPLDDPFLKADELVAEASKRTPYIFIDFHAEATSEKLALGWYTDGRASAVVGTHTHVQTADNRILPKGTAYITDVGMTGPYDGILGMDRETIIKRFKTNLPVRFTVAEGKTTLSGVVIDIDDQTKKAVKIERILINDDHMFFE